MNFVQLLGDCNSRCMPDLNLLVSPQAVQFWEDKAKSYGPTVSGALFGAGWWFWVDACAGSSSKIPFVQYLPGIVATLALVMINAISRGELLEYDPFDEGVFCRSRFWLFLAYVVSFGSIIGAMWVLLQDYALNSSTTEIYPGVAVLCQVTLILGAALLFFVSRTGAEADGFDYSSF